MKTKLTNLVMLLFVIFHGYGQSYEPLVRENAHWVVASHNNMPWQYEDFREYYTHDDTIVGDTLYKKVYRIQLEPSDEYGSPPYTRTGNRVLYGLLREDTVERIVYGRKFNIEPYYCLFTEDTLYDFSITQYDTIELCIGEMGPMTFDTVYYENVFGYYRKNLILSNTSNYPFVKLYEGIGSINGLFDILGIPSKDTGASGLVCYTIGDISNCDILTQTHEGRMPDIEMYPNPLKGEYLYARLPGDSKNVTVLVSDVYGKPMYQSVLGPGLNKMGLGALDKGVYLIKIIAENKLLLNKKILKIS